MADQLSAISNAAAGPGNVDIQLDLFLDYANNVKLYPSFQEYFRKWKPPLFAILGEARSLFHSRRR